MKHLTEEELQQYSSGGTPAITAHVQSCRQCREQIAVYHDIADTLKRDEAILPADFEQRVQARIASLDVRKNQIRESAILWLIYAIASSVAVYFTIPLLPLSEQFGSVFKKLAEIIGGIGSSIPVSALFIVIPVVILLLVELLDRKLLKPHLRVPH